MAVTDQELALLDQMYQSEISSTRFPTALSRTEWRAAWTATRDWIAANQGDYNKALPLAARQELTLKQKFILFMAVAEQEALNNG